MTIALIDYGQFNVNWLRFLLDFKSRKIYEEFIKKLIQFCTDTNTDPMDFNTGVINFFDHLKGLLKPDGTPRYAPTNFRPWYSIVKSFYQ